MQEKVSPDAQPVENLLERLLRISDQSIDDVTDEEKNSYLAHPMKNAMFSVLCDMKEKIVLSPPKEADDKTEAQLTRLDTMLAAEGVLNDFSSASSSSFPPSSEAKKEDNEEYQNELIVIRKEYSSSLQNWEQKKNGFSQTLGVLLRKHGEIRPLLGKDIQTMVDIIHKKFNVIQVQIKQNICERLMQTKSRHLDNRRKRRNFTKEAIEILNDYFYSHLDHPYPSDELKEQLARQCGINVSQVSNWFGNKRIRYKKSMGKNPEEAMRYASKTAASSSSLPVGMIAPSNYGMFPYPQPMLNPYANYAMGGQTFDFSLYNPQLNQPPNPETNDNRQL